MYSMLTDDQGKAAWCSYEAAPLTGFAAFRRKHNGLERQVLLPWQMEDPRSIVVLWHLRHPLGGTAP